MRALISKSGVLGIIAVVTMGCGPSLEEVIASVAEQVEATASSQGEIAAIYTADLEQLRAALEEPTLCGNPVDAEELIEWQSTAAARFGKERAEELLGLATEERAARQECLSQHQKALESQAALEELLSYTQERYQTVARAMVGELIDTATSEPEANDGGSTGQAEAQQKLLRLADEQPDAMWATLTGASRAGPVLPQDARRESTRVKEEALEAIQSMRAEAGRAAGLEWQAIAIAMSAR